MTMAVPDFATSPLDREPPWLYPSGGTFICRKSAPLSAAPLSHAATVKLVRSPLSSRPVPSNSAPCVGSAQALAQSRYAVIAVAGSAGSTVGTLTVDPADPATAITAYRDWASACADPTHGAEFDGTGRLDRGDLTSFTVAACDNGAAESGADFLQMNVPPLGYSHGGSLSSGDVAKSGTAIVILQDGFESGNLSEWTQDNPGANRYSLSTDPARVKSGMYSLQALFTPTNTYRLITRWFMPGYDEVYVKFSVMFEENFDDRYGLHFLTMAGNGIDDPYSSWGKAGIRPNGTDYFYAGVDPEFINGDPALKPLHFYTYWPDMTCPPLYPADPCYGNPFYQTSPKIPLVGGQWQEVVFHIKLNTPGQY